MSELFRLDRDGVVGSVGLTRGLSVNGLAFASSLYGFWPSLELSDVVSGGREAPTVGSNFPVVGLISSAGCASCFRPL